MALDASPTEMYVTKPNPLDLPVSRSIIILVTKSVTFKGNIKVKDKKGKE